MTTTLEAVGATLNPDSGQGLGEAIIAWLFIVGYMVLLGMGKNVPESLNNIITLIASVYFAVHVTQNSAKKK